jgi:hypothetical protein
MENRTPRIAVVEHASEQGFWRIDVLAPTDRLVPFMRRFNAYAEHETGFVRRRELPSGAAFLSLIWALQPLQASAGRLGVASLAKELG